MHLLAARQEDLDAGPQAVDLGQTPADLVMLSFSDSDLTALAACWARNRDRLPALRLANLARLGHPLSVDLYVDSVIRKAKLVVLRLLGGAGYWRYGLDHVAAACRESGVALAVLPGCAQPNPALDGYGTIPTEAAQRLWRYFTEGGPDNMANLLAYAATLSGQDLPWREPAPVPRFGVYEGWSSQTAAPCAPVVFYRSHLLAGDLEPVHALCEALAARGLAPLPLFVASLKEPDCAAWMRATLTARDAAVVLNLTGFSAAREDGSPLEANGTPVLQAVLSTTPEEGWRGSARGMGPSDLAMNVVLPEMDGRILTRAIAFKAEGTPDPGLEFAPTLIRPVPDRVGFAADLAAVLDDGDALRVLRADFEATRQEEIERKQATIDVAERLPRARFTGIALQSEDGQTGSPVLRSGDGLIVAVEVEAESELPAGFEVGVALATPLGTVLGGTSTRLLDTPPGSLLGTGRYRFRLGPLPLGEGEYIVQTALTLPDGSELHAVPEAAHFTVDADGRSQGPLRLDATFEDVPA